MLDDWLVSSRSDSVPLLHVSESDSRIRTHTERLLLPATHGSPLRQMEDKVEELCLFLHVSLILLRQFLSPRAYRNDLLGDLTFQSPNEFVAHDSVFYLGFAVKEKQFPSAKLVISSK